jgi:hypothetical protein
MVPTLLISVQTYYLPPGTTSIDFINYPNKMILQSVFVFKFDLLWTTSFKSQCDLCGSRWSRQPLPLQMRLNLASQSPSMKDLRNSSKENCWLGGCIFELNAAPCYMHGQASGSAPKTLSTSPPSFSLATTLPSWRYTHSAHYTSSVPFSQPSYYH